MSITYKKNYIIFSREALLKLVKKSVNDRRYQHILGVEAAAIDLAKFYHYLDIEKVSISALLHDLCKDFDTLEMSQLAYQFDKSMSITESNPAIWHGPAAAQYGMNRLDLRDQEIIEAISQHTIGSPEMSLLSKIIFVADYTEAGRDFKGVNQARKLAKSNLDLAVIYKMKETIKLLAKNQEMIYLPSVKNYNARLLKLKESL